MDNNRLILTADKGVALVVIDKADYIKKAEELLKEKHTRRSQKTLLSNRRTSS